MKEAMLAVLFGSLISVGIIAIVLVIDTPRREAAALWDYKCEESGGIPSKYETTVNKTHHSERLCIKRESVVEIEG